MRGLDTLLGDLVMFFIYTQIAYDKQLGVFDAQSTFLIIKFVGIKFNIVCKQYKAYPFISLKLWF
jgi:hypothetical protein